jgi:hypothetical protein
MTKTSWNHIMHASNVPYKVEVPHTTTILPKWEQKGEKHGHMRNEFSYASAEIEEIISSTSKCSSTSSWITHNGCSSSKPNINVHTIWSVGTSKHLDSIVMGNHEELKDVILFPHIPLIQQNHITERLHLSTYICSWIAKTFRALNQSPWQSASCTHILVQLEGGN